MTDSKIEKYIFLFIKQKKKKKNKLNKYIVRISFLRNKKKLMKALITLNKQMWLIKETTSG